MTDIAWQSATRVPSPPDQQQNPQQQCQPEVDRQQRSRRRAAARSRGSMVRPIRGLELRGHQAGPAQPAPSPQSRPDAAGPRMAEAVTHISSPPIQPTCARHRCSVSHSAVPGRRNIGGAGGGDGADHLEIGIVETRRDVGKALKKAARQKKTGRTTQKPKDSDISGPKAPCRTCLRPAWAMAISTKDHHAQQARA